MPTAKLSAKLASFGQTTFPDHPELLIALAELLIALAGIRAPVLLNPPGAKTLSRNVVLVESVSTPYDIISGATSGVQIRRVWITCCSCPKIVEVCMVTR